MEEQGRGQLTARIEKRSKELLGYEVTVRELRLMPYIQTIMTNNQKLEPAHLNQEERDIIQKWIEADQIQICNQHIKITKKFWDIMCEIIFLGYVDLSK